MEIGKMSRRQPKPSAWAWGPVFLLVWGALAPTALDGQISVPLILLSTVLLLLLDVFMIYQWGLTSRAAQIAGAGVLLVPSAVTIMAHAERVAWGALMPFSALAAMYFVNLRAIKATRLVNFVFLCVSLILLCLAAAVVYDASLVRDFMIAHYSAHYEQLIPNMLAAGKPVGPFATHSVAALFYYLFFLLHVRAFSILRRTYNLVLALGFLAAIPLLKSNSGVAFTVIGLAQLLLVLFRTKSTLSKIYGWGIVAASGICLWLFQEALLGILRPILYSDVNGLAGRFSQTGMLQSNIAFILEHPFAPVGFAYRSELFYGDCGYVEMLIRGSLPLFAAVYCGLFSYLRQNLLSKEDLRSLLVSIGVMEVGFSNLITMRFLYLLPFVVIFLNSLERLSRERAERQEGRRGTADDRPVAKARSARE